MDSPPTPPTPPADSDARHAKLVTVGFDAIDNDLKYLVGCFREVLEELGEAQLARHLDDVQAVPDDDEYGDGGSSSGGAESREDARPSVPERVAQVDSIWFQLLNMVEENASQQVRRLRENDFGQDNEPGLWGRVLSRLKQSGLSDAQIAAALPHVRVEPVLTAHPTEAKPTTVIEQHRAIYRLLENREAPVRTEAERQQHREATKAALERLWRTGEILLQKPDVSAERANLLFYLRDVFPEAVDGLDLRLRRTWATAGLDPTLMAGTAHMPQVRFGLWAGGDRDGHPHVTHATTRETLGDLRRGAISSLAKSLSRLANKMSLSSFVQRPPEALVTRVQTLAASHPTTSELTRLRHPDEPWRQSALLMRAHLPPRDVTYVDPPAGDRPPRHYDAANELVADLKLLRQSLLDVGADRLAEADVDPVIRRVESLGFHLAKLDVRQNSAYHDRAMAQLLAAANFPDGRDWAEWSEERRLDLLRVELGGPRPFARFGRKIGPECDELLATYRVLATHIDTFGREGLGSLIVSMTHRLSDLLTVYVFARESGVARYHYDADKGTGSLVCALPVVPLFETLEDLQASPPLMRAFLAHLVTRASMAGRPGRPPSLLATDDAALPVQQVMLGYSDSNKVSGILSSQYALHQAQDELTRIGEEVGVRLRFFHGRGGTISRGAGPTHRFLESLPPLSLGGDVRLTEQGETVAQKYANPATATYNLELLVAGVTGVTLTNRAARDAAAPHPLEKTVARLSEESQRAYRDLIHAADFMTFFSGATPIDVLEQSNIGSRPARRTGQRTLDDLRAIPWVFSWNQSRYYLPGWFGTGTALAALHRDDAAAFDALAAGAGDWPFLKYVLTNVETNLASADVELMRAYATLVGDEAVRASFLDRILAEFDRTERMLNAIFGGGPLPERRPRMVKTLKLRDARLRVLHQQQIELLTFWRPLRETSATEADILLPQLLLNVNAIASGLRTTG